MRWTVVAVTALVLLVTAGSRAAPGALLVEMELDTGWSKATLSFAAALGFLVYGAGGPFAGRLMGVYGPKRVVLVSIGVTSLGMALAATATAPWVLHLTFGLIAGIGSGLIASVLGAVVATTWFTDRRGLVLGIFGAAVSAGHLVFYPALTRLGVSTTWRTAVLAYAALAATMAIPVLLWFRNGPPADEGSADGTSDGRSRAPDSGVMGRAIQRPEFWLLVATFFVCGATSNGLVGQHFIPHAVDHDFSQETAATWLAVMGAFNFVGTIASGWLTDRHDPRRLLLVYYGFRGISLLALPFVHDDLSAASFAVLFGLDYIATVPPTIALCAEVFGSRNAGLVYGWVFAAHQIGSAGAAWAAGAARDGLGDYDLVFTSAGLIAICAGLAATQIRRSAVTLRS